MRTVINRPRRAAVLSPDWTAAPVGVLVADDDPHVRTLLGRVLRANGFRPVLAADGAEALRTYAEQRDNIGVVLLDVRMPGLTGPETLEGLRRIDPDVRCCFMSGDTGGATESDLLRCGALGLFPKPLELDDLLATLRALAGRSGE